MVDVIADWWQQYIGELYTDLEELEELEREEEITPEELGPQNYKDSNLKKH